MRLSHKSIERFADIITGHSNITNQLEKKDIDEFLIDSGFKGLVSSYEDVFNGHDNILNNINYKEDWFKLKNYVVIIIEKMNNLKDLKIFTEKFIEYITPLYTDYNLRKGQDDKLLEIFEEVNQEFSKDNYHIIKIEEDNKFALYSLDDSIVSYECYFKEKKYVQFSLINQHYQKCIDKMNYGDYSGAITNSQSFLEQILVLIRNEIKNTPKKGHSGSLEKLLKEVLQLLKITEGLDEVVAKAYLNIGKGALRVSKGLSLVRHSMSDAHSISQEPTKNDALLAVNTAKTLANFIVEHYFEKYLPNQKAISA